MKTMLVLAFASIAFFSLSNAFAKTLNCKQTCGSMACTSTANSFSDSVVLDLDSEGMAEGVLYSDWTIDFVGKAPQPVTIEAYVIRGFIGAIGIKAKNGKGYALETARSVYITEEQAANLTTEELKLAQKLFNGKTVVMKFHSGKDFHVNCTIKP